MLMKKGLRELPTLSRYSVAAFSMYSSRNGIPTTPFSGVFLLAVDFEIFLRRLASLPGRHALGYLIEHCAQFRAHVGKPFRVAVGVSVQM
jgi:hypothetical protein